MKKLFIITLGLLSLFLFTSFFIRNDIYYYAYNEKIELYPVDNKLIVRYKDNKKRNINNISQNQAIEKYIVDWRDDSTLVITTNNESEKNNLIEILRKNTEVKTFNNVYRINGSNCMMEIADEFVVRFKDYVTKAQIDSIHEHYKVTVIRTNKIYQLLKVQSYDNALEIANCYQESGLTKFSHPNAYSKVDVLQNIPNDEYFNMQFYLHNTGQIFNDGHSGTTGADIKAPEAWNITKGDSSIIIAVLDQGVTINHPDLPNSRQVRLNGSNFIDDNTPNDPSPANSDNHGNSCAGIIAATQNNEQGIAGIAPNCKIMPIKVLGGTYEEFALAILFAYENGADVISNSWGYTGITDKNAYPVIVEALRDAVVYGRNWLGCIVTFAASNTANHDISDNGTISFPSNVLLSSVLTVGASDRYDKQANYSPTSVPISPNNQMIDLVAPSNRSMPWQNIAGETYEVWSIDIPDITGYNRWSVPLHPPERWEELPNWGMNYSSYTGRFGGTSAACPQVAAVAALVLSLNPKLTHGEVYDILTRTADKVGGYTYTNGRSNELGYGRLNAYRSVSQAITITGSDILCSATSPYKLGNLDILPADWNVTWSVTPSNIVSLSQTNNYINLTPIGKGKVTITANLLTQYPSDARTITKEIWVGAPNTPIIVGPSTLGNGETGLYTTNRAIQPTSVLYQWHAVGLQVIGANNMWKCNLKLTNAPPAIVYLRAYDGCSENGLDYVEGSFTLSFLDYYTIAIYPNPASENVEVTILENSNLAEISTSENEFKIFDNQNNLKKHFRVTQNSLNFNITDLQAGIYFLQVTHKGKTKVKQLVVSR